MSEENGFIGIPSLWKYVINDFGMKVLPDYCWMLYHKIMMEYLTESSFFIYSYIRCFSKVKWELMAYKLCSQI